MEKDQEKSNDSASETMDTVQGILEKDNQVFESNEESPVL